MVKYSCETCQKIFTQKGHFEKHKNRILPCKKDNTIEIIVEQKIKEMLSKNNITDVTIKNEPIDYSNKTREELIVICKEKNIKGYSGKKKDDIIKLLSDNSFNKENIVQPTIKNIEYPKNLQNKIRYIDLFCGLGAFHTAFNKSNIFECVLACDIDEGVRKIYNENYNIEPKKDIRELNIQELPEFEILCAGFPCQPFSIAGNGEGFNDTTKGNLFFDILKIIDVKNPKMCILENVKNLKTHDEGKTYKTIENELKKRGYFITSKVINSSEYGSPQARHRIFIVATKNKLFTIPDGININVPVRSIIDFSVNNNDLNMELYTLVKKSTKENIFGKPNIIYDVISKRSNKGGRQGERVYSIESAGITVCASSGGPGAKTGLYKINDNIRRLTVKETLGMFGFPIDYKFSNVSQEEALFYLGNSIVVNVILSFIPNILEWFDTKL